jgi:hypothetical protein
MGNWTVMINQHGSFNREGDCQLRHTWKIIKKVKQQRMLQTLFPPYKGFPPPKDKPPTHHTCLGPSLPCKICTQASAFPSPPKPTRNHGDIHSARSTARKLKEHYAWWIFGWVIAWQHQMLVFFLGGGGGVAFHSHYVGQFNKFPYPLSLLAQERYQPPLLPLSFVIKKGSYIHVSTHAHI